MLDMETSSLFSSGGNNFELLLHKVIGIERWLS